jgi:signal transduction histidine kinase
MKVRTALFSIILVFVACSSVAERDMMAVEEANDLSYRLRYTDISASLQAAKEAYSLSSKNSDGRTEAINNMAYVAYQQMRYDQTLHLLQRVYGQSRNQLELLCADVLTMKVMQRIGRGKSFFDSRLRAGKRISRILSEESSLTNRQLHRLHYALTEFHIVASTYYYYLGQEASAQQEIQEAAQYVNLETDTTQWLYYHYMLGSGGLVEGTPEEIIVTEFDHLIRVYTLARANHFTYFEANALQSLSAMITDSLRASLLKQQRLDAYSYLYEHHRRWRSDTSLSSRHQFAAALSHHSVALFQEYRDLFQTACALRTLGEVYFSAEQYDAALCSFRSALHLASDHRRSPYQVIPWLAGIHENLSLTYSALGNKRLADEHRNKYLDLLDQSRQNRELDSRKALLGQEAHREQIQFILLLLLVVVVVILSAIYYRQLGHRSRSFEQKVREIGSSEACAQATQKLQELLQKSEERLEEGREECEVIQQRLLHEQQRHILQRARLSVVYAIIPYLDRVTHEVKKLDKKEGDVSEHLSYIQELCGGMMTINDRLTEWIQMQQGRPGFQVTRFPLNEVLQVISMQRYAFAKKQLTLQVAETELHVKADKPLTLFMVNTLVDNARKFTPEGGKVSVELDATDDYVEVSVCDTGIGLSPEDVKILCDNKVYDSSHIGAPNADKGFGFGIMNCKGIINSYRKLSSLFSVCDFGVESRLGQGSRFWFRLPRVLPVLLLLLSGFSSAAMPRSVRELYDSTFAANLEGRYAEACLYADHAIRQMKVPVDTPLLVALYNEQAIAAQAIGRWDTYRRSNAECVRLHRLYSTDGTLASDCQRLEKMTADSRVLYVLIVLLFIASLALFYMVVLRNRLRHRASLDDLYQRLTSVLRAFPENAETLDSELQSIVRGFNQPQLRQPVGELRQMLFSGLAQVQEMKTDAWDTEEMAQRWRFEHDRLYVMNQILDNSLSTIKHETMYFPSRIKQLADDMQQSGFDAETNHNLLDLVTYYRHIYMLLYEQAQGQMDQTPLRVQPIAIDDLFGYANTHHVSFEPTTAIALGDEKLLRLFLDQLISVVPKTCRLSAEERGGMVYVNCDVYEQTLAPGQLMSLFTPQTRRLEYLVMRQIVREHDAACGHPGLRLVSENTECGYRISFSLLQGRNNETSK